MNDILKELTLLYVKEPDNVEYNWNIARHYHALGQYAAAVGFYVRAAERTDDTLLQYECMVRSAMCFASQGIRKFSVKGMLQHAVALHPERPEAYYHLCNILSNEYGDGSWFDSYTYATLGLRVTKPLDELPELRTNVDYPGMIGIEFQRAHAAWHCGMCEESRDLHRELYQRTDISPELKEIVKNNLIIMNAFQTNQIEHFKPIDTSDLRCKFVGVDRVERNHSESFQDMFVLTMTNGKENGTYLEIGAGSAEYGNNTLLLEQKFGWTGLSFDVEEAFVKEHNEKRKHVCLLRDATTVNYEKMLPAMDLPNDIDYLQIDCDPPEVSFKVLLSIPFETHRFAVITFEHDHYTDPDNSIREKARKYLESHGYVLVVNNIAPDDWRAYEDWWVHPELVDKKILEKMTLVNDNVKKAKDYMLGKIQ